MTIIIEIQDQLDTLSCKNFAQVYRVWSEIYGFYVDRIYCYLLDCYRLKLPTSHETNVSLEDTLQARAMVHTKYTALVHIH